MSYKWPDKDPDETIDYSVDWSRFLGADTITSANWFVINSSGTKQEFSAAQTIDNLQFIQGTLTSQVTTARFALGTNNTRYTIVCKVNTDQGLSYERSIFLRIKEK